MTLVDRAASRRDVLMDLTVAILIALISSGSALAATALAHKYQRDAGEERFLADRNMRYWETKREVFIEFLHQIDNLDSRTTGRLLGGVGRLPEPDEAAPIVAARTRVEFYAAPDTWAAAERLAKAVALRSNLAASGSVPSLRQQEAAIERQLADLGGLDPDGMDRLRVAYIDACRSELNLP